MAAGTARKKKTQVHQARVVRTERLTPGMVRVVLGLAGGSRTESGGLTEFSVGEYTDHYVKLLFPSPGAAYPEPFDIDRIRADLPRDQWPMTRTYTVRAWAPATRELTLDFVVHGDEGLAGPWAQHAEPGDEVRFLGPGGAYSPSPDADWHLLAGDASALPAIAAALEAMPAEASVRALIEVDGPEEEQKLSAPDTAEVVWLHRGTSRVGTRLIEAVRALEFPAGQPHAFVHGEAGFVKELRRHLRIERGVEREQLSISGYWRLGHDEEGWRASKKEWKAGVEAEQETPAQTPRQPGLSAPATGEDTPPPSR